MEEERKRLEEERNGRNEETKRRREEEKKRADEDEERSVRVKIEILVEMGGGERRIVVSSLSGNIQSS